MITSPRIAVAAALFALAGCGEPAPSGDEDLGAASDELGSLADEYFVANVVPHGDSVYQISPDYLVDSNEGWGPQTLQLVVDRHFTPQIIVSAQPGVEVQKDKIKKTLQRAVAFSLSQEIELTASSAHEVLPGAYERLEAYPTFQSITFDVYTNGYGYYGLIGPQFVARGTCLKPRGVFFRVVTYVSPPRGATNPKPAPGMSAALPEGIEGIPVTDEPPNGNGTPPRGNGNGNGRPASTGAITPATSAAGPVHGD